MTDKSMQIRVRFAGRVLAIAKNRADLPTIAAVAATAGPAATEFLARHDAYNQALQTWNRESGESRVAQGPLGKAYDAARGVLMARVPAAVVGPAATNVPTPDELLHHAEQVEAVLEAISAETWAKPVLDGLHAALDTATKEWSEAVVAKSALRGAIEARQAAAVAFDTAVVGFRRVARAELGRASPEYRSIRVLRGQGGEEVAPDEAPTEATGA